MEGWLYDVIPAGREPVYLANVANYLREAITVAEFIMRKDLVTRLTYFRYDYGLLSLFLLLSLFWWVPAAPV